MELPEGATLAYGEEKRITDALEALEKDQHAPRSLTVQLGLHVHNEYPKHVIVGSRVVATNDDGEVLTAPITVVVNNRKEEAAALKSAKPAKPAAKPEDAA